MNNAAERAYRWAGEEGQQVDCPSLTSSWREMILMEQTLDVCEEGQEEELKYHHNHD